MAEHRRSFGHHEQIEDPRHIEQLKAAKHQAKKHCGFSRLYQAVPAAQELIRRLAERGENLGSATSYLLRLLDEHGAAALQHAAELVLEKDVAHPHAVRLILDQERRRAGLMPRIPIELPDDPRVRDLVVVPHKLASYDAIAATRVATEDPHDQP